MKKSRTTTILREVRWKEDFWNAVKDCLVELYGIPRRNSSLRVRALRKRHWKHGRKVADFAYHQNPEEIARALSRKFKNPNFAHKWKKWELKKYNEILKRNNMWIGDVS